MLEDSSSESLSERGIEGRGRRERDLEGWLEM